MIAQTAHRRTVRSYVRREGRMTKAQRRALEELWPGYGIEDAPVPLDFIEIFGRDRPVILEIGFGNGEVLATMAAAQPENDFLGVEVHRPGVGSLLRRLEAAGARNVKVILADAGQVLAARVPDGSLAAVHLFFPDPWPKKRHRKRRLVQLDFVELVRRRLKPRGYIHLATDWRDYAEFMLAVLSQTPGFENTEYGGGYSCRPPRPHTKFEQRGRRLGHDVWDLVFRRSD